ncbi:MAG: sulfoxide reductase heme-binding subunit YedZ [Caldilineaceae bacterium]|nr:sulfoxide reductase heme-binding subunit YedZ [Caldilineaceae bacterium]
MSRLTLLLRKNWLWLAVNLAAAVPLLLLAWDFATDSLGINPIDAITDRTGTAALITLIASLAVTPINIIFGYRPIIKVRKSLGLFAFFYAALHFLTFVGLDYGFSLYFILQDGLVQKPYILAGFAAFLILLPLAITSTKGWMRRLGRNWTRLHSLVYAAGILAVLHFIWIAKIDLGEPLIYAVVLGLLLLVRVPKVRKTIANWRRRPSGPRPSSRELEPQAARIEPR